MRAEAIKTVDAKSEPPVVAVALIRIRAMTVELGDFTNCVVLRSEGQLQARLARLLQ